MRLKKLILQGFKSFADRTEFVFDCPITGIVGPNGCGKSNVVDAFKWVLGEQSAKSLRGDAMLDVIFNGSGGRKPAGMAEVVLVFENPLREDGTRLLALDTDDVAVGRRLFRDGSSEYQLNNQTSRLKDIRELFLDTGVGVDAYSVIEQGRVAALLEANPEERRLIFEEAAGISKFKQRKKEAQRKLEKVDQNLLRVNDIVEEVDKRLRSVKVQAGKARNFQEYQGRLNELRLTYALQEYHTHSTHLAHLDKQREDAQFRLDDSTGDLARAQNELAEKREQHEALSQKRQRIEYELVQARAAMQSAQQRQHYAQQQLEQIAEGLAGFDRDRAGLEEKAAVVASALDAEAASLSRLTEELEEHRRRIDERQQSFRDGQLALNNLNREIEQHKSAILELMRALAQTNNALSSIDIERKNIAGQQARLAERRRVVVQEIERLEAQRGELQEKLETAKATIEEQQAQLDARRGEAAQLGKQIAGLAEQLGSAKEHRSGLISRQKLLTDLETKREGVSEGVKSVLRQRGEKFAFIRGLVADVLRVDVEHARVIEAALDGRDQWLVTDDSAAASDAREALEGLEGRVNILCADELRLRQSRAVSSPETERGVPQDRAGDSPALNATYLFLGPAQERIVMNEDRGLQTHASYDWNQHPQRIRMAVDLVRFEAEGAAIAEHLLGRTVLVDSLADARELHQKGPCGWRYVTPDGEVLEADGTLRAGPLTAAMGLLSRRSELEALALQLADVDQRIARLTEQVSQGNTAAKTLEETINALRNSVYQANTEKVQLESSIAQNQDKQGALRREQPVLDRELAGFLDQIGKLAAREQELAGDRAAMEAEQASRQEQVEQKAQLQAETAEHLRQWGEELTAIRVQLGQVQEKQLACQQHVQRLTGQKAELAQQIERVVSSAEALVGRRDSVQRELDEAAEAERTLEARQKELAGQMQSLAGRVDELAGHVRELTGRVEKLRESHAQIEQTLHGLQLQISEIKVRLETLVARTQEELQIDLLAKYAEVTAPPPPPRVEGAESAEPAAGYQPAEMDWDAVAVEIKDLREKINRLGNVNLDAIGELEELEQRSGFLSSQLTDLTNSKQQLEQLIEEINTESSLRFEQTFNIVREHFQGMFRKVFGGGSADIFLETEIEDKKAPRQLGPDGQTMLPVMKKLDVLEAGIEIIARPPGKKPVSISQLSGGEKAMTCIALLMSIFKSKPSPFCILDEVDAPLDEANNVRFGLIVQEFLATSQFIIITHHKRTMQIADVLYGVTMQEQGVSKRVAVKFDQVDSQGRISGVAEREVAAVA
jgi:chromosome segregation protein